MSLASGTTRTPLQQRLYARLDMYVTSIYRCPRNVVPSSSELPPLSQELPASSYDRGRNPYFRRSEPYWRWRSLPFNYSAVLHSPAPPLRWLAAGLRSVDCPVRHPHRVEPTTCTLGNSAPPVLPHHRKPATTNRHTISQARVCLDQPRWAQPRQSSVNPPQRESGQRGGRGYVGAPQARQG